MKWVLILFGGAGLLVGIALATGMMLPDTHIVSRRAELALPPAEIWQIMTDYAGSPAWRSDIAAVERLPDRDGRPAWRELDADGSGVTLETVEEIPPRLLVRRIADSGGPFGGTLSIEVQPTRAGSLVTVTEIGETYAPLYRFFSRVTMRQAAAIERFIGDLARRAMAGTAPPPS